MIMRSRFQFSYWNLLGPIFVTEIYFALFPSSQTTNQSKKHIQMHIKSS